MTPPWGTILMMLMALFIIIFVVMGMLLG